MRDTVSGAAAADSDAGYGLYVWPSSRLLAELVWWYGRDGALRGSHLLELGCGTSLPGVVAAQCGARVALTDRSAHQFEPAVAAATTTTTTTTTTTSKQQQTTPLASDSLTNARTIAYTLNGLSAEQCSVAALRWGQFSSAAMALKQQNKWDLLIGADIFFDPKGMP